MGLATNWATAEDAVSHQLQSSAASDFGQGGSCQVWQL